MSDWTRTTTADAAIADRLIMEHVSCEHVDTESETFHCYDCSVSVRWVG